MKYLRLLIVGLTLAAVVPFATAQQKKAEPVKSLRLYILDCGDITGVGEAEFGFKAGQLADSRMVTPCYLVVHPRGTMMWDTGEIPDTDFKAPGPTKAGAFTITKPLLPQLAALGYTPADINYLALSHYHGDHVANANAFAGSTWIVQDIERTAMFAKQDGKAKGPTAPDAAFFGKLEKSKTTLLHSEDHDVFGDGTVVIKFTPGHTPGHQSLLIKLPKTGALVLSGDAVHCQANWDHRRVPFNNVDQEQTKASMERIAGILAKEKATLWINHDKAQRDRLQMAPGFYE